MDSVNAEHLKKSKSNKKYIALVLSCLLHLILISWKQCLVVSRVLTCKIDGAHLWNGLHRRPGRHSAGKRASYLCSRPGAVNYLPTDAVSGLKPPASTLSFTHTTRNEKTCPKINVIYSRKGSKKQFNDPPSPTMSKG